MTFNFVSYDNIRVRMTSYFDQRKKYVYYVNSANRLNESDTDTNFSYKFVHLQDDDFDRVVVLSASIPKSFYLVQAGQNTMTLQEGISSVVLSFTPGNYNRNSLLATMKTLLNTKSPNGWTYNITYPNINQTYDDGKYYFTVTGNSSQPSFLFGNYMAEQLGFNHNSVNAFVSSSLVSTNVCNLSTETTLFLHSNIMQSGTDDNVLQEIYSNGESSYSYINYQNVCPHEYAKELTSNMADTFNFYLTDESGNIINTNGININFTIMVYKTNIVDRVVTGYLKMKALEDMTTNTEETNTE